MLDAFFGFLLKKRQIFRYERGGSGKPFSQFRGIVFFEKRKELVPDFVPEKLIGGIAFIRAERKFSNGKIIENIGSRSMEQGTDETVILRTHGRETAKARSAEEVKEKGFCLIILMMGGDDGVGLRFSADFLKKSIPYVAKPFLEIILRSDFRVKDEKRKVISAGEFFDEELVSIGVAAAQTIVDMGECDLKIVLVFQISENIEETNAIGTAGNAENKAVSVAPELIRGREVLYAANKAPRSDREALSLGSFR